MPGRLQSMRSQRVKRNLAPEQKQQSESNVSEDVIVFVRSISHGQLSATPWTIACQAP